jgi:hypothetical protein
LVPKNLISRKLLMEKKGGRYFNKKLKWDLIRGREPQPNHLKLSTCHPYDDVTPKLKRDSGKTSFKASLAHASRTYTQGLNRSQA